MQDTVTAAVVVGADTQTAAVVVGADTQTAAVVTGTTTQTAAVTSFVDTSVVGFTRVASTATSAFAQAATAAQASAASAQAAFNAVNSKPWYERGTKAGREFQEHQANVDARRAEREKDALRERLGPEGVARYNALRDERYEFGQDWMVKAKAEDRYGTGAPRESRDNQTGEVITPTDRSYESLQSDLDLVNEDINKLLGLPPGTMKNTLPKLARGGIVGAGRPYMVGERGPETFIPSSSGSILPNGLTAEAIGEAVARALQRVPLSIPQNAVTDSILRATPQRQALRGWT